jgi:hypothetical protein
MASAEFNGVKSVAVEISGRQTLSFVYMRMHPGGIIPGLTK